MKEKFVSIDAFIFGAYPKSIRRSLVRFDGKDGVNNGESDRPTIQNLKSGQKRETLPTNLNRCYKICDGTGF